MENLEDFIFCPYCYKEQEEYKDEEYHCKNKEFEIQCPYCKKYFDIIVHEDEEVNYYYSFEILEKEQPEYIIDVPNQLYFWNDLDLGKLKIY